VQQHEHDEAGEQSVVPKSTSYIELTFR